MSVDDQISSVVSTASNSLEDVASSNNTSLNHPNDSFDESESEKEENSESESQWEEISSDDGDDNEDTELSVLLQALRTREEIQDLLSSPIPSASQIVKDAETVHVLLHKDFETARDPQVRPEEQSHLINLMTNITQQMENLPPEGSDIGPALHAARQVGYWSSVFISMVSNNTSTPTNVSNSLPMFTAPVISSSSNLSPLVSQALVPSTVNQATPTAHLSPSIQLSTTQRSPTRFIPSWFNHPALPISTALVISSGINPSPQASQALIPSTINQAIPTVHLSPSIQLSTTQHCPTSLIPSSSNHPTLCDCEIHRLENAAGRYR